MMYILFVKWKKGYTCVKSGGRERESLLDVKLGLVVLAQSALPYTTFWVSRSQPDASLRQGGCHNQHVDSSAIWWLLASVAPEHAHHISGILFIICL